MHFKRFSVALLEKRLGEFYGERRWGRDRQVNRFVTTLESLSIGITVGPYVKEKMEMIPEVPAFNEYIFFFPNLD